jgi:hypothetical protein
MDASELKQAVIQELARLRASKVLTYMEGIAMQDDFNLEAEAEISIRCIEMMLASFKAVADEMGINYNQQGD